MYKIQYTDLDNKVLDTIHWLDNEVQDIIHWLDNEVQDTD
jgi:hypothetical protein